MAETVALLDQINSGVFDGTGFTVEQFPASVTPDELASVVQGAQILGVRSAPKVPGNIIEAAPALEAVGCFCIGTEQVDMATANHAGVAVFNSTFENTRSVAEYVIAGTINLLRQIPQHNAAMHGGTWTKPNMHTVRESHEVLGKTLGIIGYGNIGSQVSVLAEVIGMDIVYFDPAPKHPPQGRARRLAAKEDVLKVADVVTLHVPGGVEDVIAAKEIALMKPGSYLINASRGKAIDEKAVAAALANGQLGGAAVDVYRNEPAKMGDRFDHALRGIEGAILTPHIAGSTIEAQMAIGKHVAELLVSYHRNGNSVGSVNLPELALNGLHPDTTRILYVHNNIPGALERSLGVIAAAGLNVAGTVHRTREDIGYAAFDIDDPVTGSVVRAISELEDARRVRTINCSS